MTYITQKLIFHLKGLCEKFLPRMRLQQFSNYVSAHSGSCPIGMVYSMYCAIRNFVHSGLCAFGIVFIRDGAHSGWCPFGSVSIPAIVYIPMVH